MASFKRHIDPGVEWLGCKENVLEENEVFELEEVDHEEFDSRSDSDEGVRRKALRKVARMNKAIQGKGERVYKEDFFLGEQFATSKLVKDKVTRVSVEQRRQLSLKKNDKGQSKVKPKSISKKEKVAKPRESYACPWAMQCPSCPMRHHEETIKPNDKITLNTLKDQLQKKFEVGVSKQKVFRAKKMAYERVVGSYSQQYAHRTLKDGFKAGGRRFHRIPWKWFLDYYCLGDDLSFSKHNFTFISDRQKGVIPAIAENFPNAEHRFCLKHIYDNMKLSWRGKFYKEMLWKCATASTIQKFDKRMEEMKNHNLEAYEWLRKIPPQHWARSHFTGRAKSNILLNNLCEVLNRQLLDGRDKPIITCLEYIREYLMKRIVNVQKVQDKCDGPLTPSTAKIFKLIVRAAAKLKVEWNGSDLYQVTCPWGDQFVVNLSERVCSCRKWELSGIPCTHAVASIWDQANNGIDTGIPESYCLPVHWLTTWKEMYKFKINPVNGPQGWKKSDVPTTIIPPKPHPQIGRPPKKRKKSAAELAE
ncbi:mutator type transposase [Tanacetum coccineum]